MTCTLCHDIGYTIRCVDHWRTELVSCPCPAGVAWAKALKQSQEKKAPPTNEG